MAMQNSVASATGLLCLEHGWPVTSTVRMCIPHGKDVTVLGKSTVLCLTEDWQPWTAQPESDAGVLHCVCNTAMHQCVSCRCPLLGPGLVVHRSAMLQARHGTRGIAVHSPSRTSACHCDSCYSTGGVHHRSSVIRLCGGTRVCVSTIVSSRYSTLSRCGRSPKQALMAPLSMGTLAFCLPW